MDLPASKLGTREYWDQFYKRDSAVYDETGDPGEIWFGESCEQAMVDWAVDNIPSSSSILELGSGNAHLLTNLYESGFHSVYGIDYSDHATELARKVVHDLGYDISLHTWDLFSADPPPARRTYSVLMDKGTYDAISLLGAQDGSPNYKKYPAQASALLESGGLLVLASCNWTRDELLAQFGPFFTLSEDIERPVFEFGGASGQTETLLVFKKRD